MVLHRRLRRTWPEQHRAELLAWISRQFRVDGSELHREYLQSQFRLQYLRRRQELRRFGGPRRMGTSGDLCLEALYLLVRAARPRIAVETGVLYGGSSGHLLAAMAQNCEGVLYNIDLPNDHREPAQDFLIPAELKDRWHLSLGPSRRELPALLRRQPQIDFLHHDSLHTFQHMTWEYRMALRKLAHHGIRSSHDVLVAPSVREIFRQNAFPAFCERERLRWWCFQNTAFAMRNGRADH